MKKITLSELNIDRIKNKEFKTALPELYDLEGVVENNLWHRNDTVFDHTVSVLTELNKLLSNAKDGINNHLNERIGGRSKKELLFLAAALHDIGKKDVPIKEGDGVKASEHEDVSARVAADVISRFDLSDREDAFVVKIVKNHGVIHDILNFPKEVKQKIETLKKDKPEIFLEIALLSIADMRGSQLEINDPKEFAYRMNLLSDIIVDY